jgi:DnaJ-domain-containing protein 1
MASGESSTRRSFPGGSVRLPRLTRPPGAPVEDMTGWRQAEPARNEPEETPPEKLGFAAYYSTESLFQPPASGSIAEEDEGPYAVLGLGRTASWEEISKARRALVARLHPDRHVGESDAVRAEAERRVRDVNEAYAMIQRERSGRSS